MENLEILNVVKTAESESDLLLAYAIDKPKKGTKKDVATIDVLGWIVGKKSPVVAVDVINGDRVLRKISIDVPRTDVGARFSTIPEAKNSGFEGTVELMGLPEEGDLFLEAVFDDESRLKIGAIQYKLETSVVELEQVSQEKTVEITEVSTGVPVDLDKIKGDLERSRAFLKKMEENLEEMTKV